MSTRSVEQAASGSARISRRAVLRAGIGVGAAAALASVELGACGTESGRRLRPGSPRYYPAQLGAAGKIKADVCIYGATAGGIMAALQAARLGSRTVLVAFGTHLGGMTTGGLSATDVGVASTISGLALEFYRAIGQAYGALGPVYNFEPKVAAAVMAEMLKGSAVTILTAQPLRHVYRDGAAIRAITTDSGSVIEAAQFVDASYEGDLLARSGVSYYIGREANSVYGETLNGIRPAPAGAGFPVRVAAFRTPANPDSGTVSGVQSGLTKPPGSGDIAVMAYSFRPTLSDRTPLRPFPRPATYDPRSWNLMAQVVAAGSWDTLNFRVKLPGGKYDLNASGGMSTDAVGLGYGWADAEYQTREQIYQNHVTYDQGLLWFLANDRRVPNSIRRGVARFGLPLDEFTDTQGWPPELYVREARRMVSDYVVTEADCVAGRAASDPVVTASYKIDSHVCRRIAVDGIATDEGAVSHQIPRPYGISLRALLPRRSEATNLTVSTCISASHVAWSSLRMEPVFMMLGQAAGTVAATACARRLAVHDIPYSQVADALRAGGLHLPTVPT